MLENVFNLSADEVIILNGLLPVAKEAKEAARAINEFYKFRVGENRIEVWQDRDGNNFEYLTHDGVWQARYLHQSYDVMCTEEEIFNLYKADYLVENGFAKRIVNGCYTEEGKKHEICRYFKSFVNNTKRKMAENKED